ncbi:MAG: hypothetical protein MUE85_22475 [Microscillaceae bacterium]|nr:hypothetical protein [Microscillaceae bacterium]
MLSNAHTKLRLDPQDEYMHTPESAENYNESMYFNVFDFQQKIGGWFRLGNRPNEGYAEMSVCLYLPHGQVAFMYARPKIADNSAFDAGGLRFTVVEPFHHLKVQYVGEVILLNEPHKMQNPAEAFAQNPRFECAIDLDFEGISPMYGGETVNLDGSPIDIIPEKTFARAHYEQHTRGRGTWRIGNKTYPIDGFGLRDKSWGPRYWQAIHWYRWLPICFGEDFGMMVSVIGSEDQAVQMGGMVLQNGQYDLIQTCTMTSEWDENYYQTALTAQITTESGRQYALSGKVLSLIPLRNRRKIGLRQELHTRITEGMTEYECAGRIGYGMSEYLDQIIDNRPVHLAF